MVDLSIVFCMFTKGSPTITPAALGDPGPQGDRVTWGALLASRCAAARSSSVESLGDVDSSVESSEILRAAAGRAGGRGQETYV